MTKISAEERAMREGLRVQTRARATKLMNAILKNNRKRQRGEIMKNTAIIKSR